MNSKAKKVAALSYFDLCFVGSLCLWLTGKGEIVGSIFLEMKWGLLEASMPSFPARSRYTNFLYGQLPQSVALQEEAQEDHQEIVEFLRRVGLHGRLLRVFAVTWRSKLFQTGVKVYLQPSCNASNPPNMVMIGLQPQLG